MKKQKYLLFILLILIISCNVAPSNKENNTIKNIVISFIEFKNRQTRIDAQKNIIIASAQIDEFNKDNYWIDLHFINPELLLNFKYSKVYEIEGYKLIIGEELNKSYLLKNSFKEVPYKNLNKAKFPFTYSTDNLHITLNSKDEIIEISPQEKFGAIKSILEKKGQKFTKNYLD